MDNRIIQIKRFPTKLHDKMRVKAIKDKKQVRELYIKATEQYLDNN